jgi:hypothetical protein
LLPDLSIQLLGVLATGCPPLTEVRLVGGENAGTGRTWHSFREALGPDEAADGAPGHTEVSGDRSNAESRLIALHHLLQVMTMDDLMLNPITLQWRVRE